MTTKFDHIRLSRAFRPVVLSTLKNDAGWPAYMTAHGWDGRSEDLTKGEIHIACEALGIDLQGMYDGFCGPSTLPAAPDVVVDGVAWTENKMERDEMTKESEAGEAGAGEAGENEGFEGREVDDVIAEALAPASVHMTPHLASIMPGLLRPIAEIAVRGPRVVVETKTVVVDSDGSAVAPAFAAPDVKVVRKTPLYGAFGMRRSDAPADYRWAFENLVVDVCNYAGAPNVDTDYIWQPETLCELAAQDNAGLNAWIFGPAGIGKTVGAEQYAARLGRPFFRIAIERTTEPSELIGQEVPAKGGGMKWSDGKLTRAFRVPYAVILIDEPTLLRSGTLATVQTALDQRALYLVTGEVVKAAQGVFVIAADNTAGNGDDSGRYVDTAPVNAAFLDRFAFKTEMGFLSVGQETKMLAARAGIHPAAAKIMVDYAHTTRTKADSGALTMGVTPRRLMAWGKTVRMGIPSAKAWRSVIVTGAAPEDRETLLMIEGADLRNKHATIDGIVRGTIDPDAPPAPEPVISAVASQFPDDDND